MNEHPTASPFKNLRELEQRHGVLLEALRTQVGETSEVETETIIEIEAELLEFLARTVATGMVLDDFGDRTRAQSLYDYWAGLLRRAGREAPRARLAAFDFDQLPPLEDDACPYVGLEPFISETFFFGREDDVKALLAQLERERLVLICGPAGVGKSSLLLAGVLPALRARQPLTLRLAEPFRPGTRPLERLAAALNVAVGRPQALSGKQLSHDPALAGKLLAEFDGPPVLVAIDQFEDLFSLVDDAERAAFDRALASLLDAGERVRLVIAMRDDLLDRVARLETLAERGDLTETIYHLRPLTPSNLVRAIEQPAACVDLELKPGVVEHLVRELLGSPATLPLLQFAMCRLWQQRKRNRVDLDTAAALGNKLPEALDSDAERRYQTVCAEAKELGALRDYTDARAKQVGLKPSRGEPDAHFDAPAIQRVLLGLVRIDDLLDYHRQVVRMDQLGDRSLDDVDEIIELLRKHGLVRVVDGEFVELAHEGLIRHWARLEGWIKQERRQLRSSRKTLADAAQRWHAEGRPSNRLLWRLQTHEARKFGGLTPLEQDFLDASDRWLLRQKNKVVVGLASSTAVALVALGLLLWMNIAEVSIRDLWREKVALQTEKDELQTKKDKLEGEKQRLTDETNQLEGKTEELEGQQQALRKDVDELGDQQTNLATELQQTKLSGFANTVGDELRGKRIWIYRANDVQAAAVTELMNKLHEQSLAVEQSLAAGKQAPATSEVRYYCDADTDHAENVQKLLREWLDIHATITRESEPCTHARRGLVELWLSRDTLTTWIQVATDQSLENAEGLLRKKRDLRHWGTEEVMIVQRRQYFVTMVGPYPSQEAAKRHIAEAPPERYEEGKIVRPLDMFCPERTPLEPLKSFKTVRVVRCDGLPPLSEKH